MGHNMWFVHVVACVAFTAGCEFPRPADVGVDAADGDALAVDAPSGVTDAAIVDGIPVLCAANQALRCERSELVRCNNDGTAEVREHCSLGCRTDELRCNDVNPSNGLAQYLDMTGGEPDLDLGATATINTDDGRVMVDGHPVAVTTASVTQSSAPTIRVLVVHSLVAGDVTVTGRDAIAIVSHGDVVIGGLLAASATPSRAGAGAFNDPTCKGRDGTIGIARGGCGGGGFAFSGGSGGSATNDDGVSAGGAGGMTTGSATLVPLRGGCDSGALGGLAGLGGGAIQVVSRTKITVGGIIAANGGSNTGGGSGGGILLEAPVVDVSGAVVANGGAGAGGCALPQPGEPGRLDAMPATGGDPCALGGRGGNGGAGNTGAGLGVSFNNSGHGSSQAYGGNGGGSVGRIRINTTAGGLHVAGLFSPNPTTGTIATR